MATTDIALNQIVFNKVSAEKYKELEVAGELNASEFYITPDEIDTKPIEGSENPITSGAVYTALSNLPVSDNVVTIDTEQTIIGNKIFNGNINVPTQDITDSSTKAASTEYVQNVADKLSVVILRKWS